MELLLALHAHLPWVKDVEHPGGIEERWLFEALWESYLPLLGVLDRAAARGQKNVLTLSISPPLLMMLADVRLRESFLEHVDGVLAIAQGASRHTRFASRQPALVDHVTRLEASRARFEEAGRDVARAFGAHHDAGVIELSTTSATHAFLPTCRSDAHVRAQLSVGRETLRTIAGVDPVGLWLPECAFDPRLDAPLADDHVGWTILDGHALLLGRPRTPLGVFAPAITPAGVAVFARDDGATRRVWSRRSGYPGDPAYREFHRDLTEELDAQELGALAPPPGAYAPVGLRLFRVTGREEKEIYEPAAAANRIAVHAAHFLEEAARSLEGAPRLGAAAPVLTAPYDAELFGHWWWEGPAFLDAVLARVHAEGVVRTTTPSDRLARHPELAVTEPAASSWGEGGFASVWTSADSAPMLRELHGAERQIERTFAALAAARFAAPRQLLARDLAARELMLAASSDWAFLVGTGTNVGYARRRAAAHVARAHELARLALAPLDEEAAERVRDVERGGPPLSGFPRDLLEAAWSCRA